MTVYIDILICSNLLINYFIISIFSNCTNTYAKKINILLSCIFASLYSLLILIPNMNMITLILSKLIFCFLTLLIAYGKNLNFRIYVIFFGIHLLLASIYFIIWSTIPQNKIYYFNGITYYNISTSTLIISSVCAYLLISQYNKITKYISIKKRDLLKVKITNMGSSVILTGFVDTGNLLKETFSQTPVVICNFNHLRKLLPTDIQNVNFDPITMYSILSKSSCKKLFRLIPYQSLNNKNEILLAFRPENFSIEINNKNYFVNDVFVSLTDNSFKTNKYQIILNPALKILKENLQK